MPEIHEEISGPNWSLLALCVSASYPSYNFKWLSPKGHHLACLTTPLLYSFEKHTFPVADNRTFCSNKCSASISEELAKC